MNYTEAYEVCCRKAGLHFEKMNGKLFEPPESKSGDYYETYPNTDFATDRWVWLSSMITGMASLLYDTNSDKRALKWANRFKREYHDKVFVPFTQTMHDLGFLYIPYSVHLYQLTGDTEHRDTALRAADELAKRFNVRGRFIEAWASMDDSERPCRMIVDCAMNTALLYWAWKETGHCFYRDIADAHMETTINVLVREDWSVAHAWYFDIKTGEPEKEGNACGYANGTHWARGTAWLVFGLVNAYSFTKNEYYLDVAEKVGKKYLDSLSDSPVPVWDFRLPEDKPAKLSGKPTDTPEWDESKPENRIYNVDTSAAAIMCCAFTLFNKLRENGDFAAYTEKSLECLIKEYLDADMTKTGILRRSNGRDVYSIYGDYFFMLALAMRIYGIAAPWGKNE